jgi:hypothetical protein
MSARDIANSFRHLHPDKHTTIPDNTSFSGSNNMASSYDDYINDFLKSSHQALINKNPGATMSSNQNNKNTITAAPVNQRNQNITAISSMNQNNQNTIATASMNQNRQSFTDNTSSVNRIHKPNTTLSIYQNKQPKTISYLRQTHQPAKPTPLRRNITTASLAQINKPSASTSAFSTKPSSQNNLGIPIPLYQINGPSISTTASTYQTNKHDKINPSLSQATNTTLATKGYDLTTGNPNLAIKNSNNQNNYEEKQDLTNKDEQSTDIIGNQNLSSEDKHFHYNNNKDKQTHNSRNEQTHNSRNEQQSTNNNGILNPSLTKDPRSYSSTLGLAISDKRNPNLNNRGKQSFNNKGNQNLTNTERQTTKHPSGPTAKQPSSSTLTCSSITNPNDSTSTSTNGSTTDSSSSSSAEDPHTDHSPSSPPPSPLPIFGHLKILDPRYKDKPYVDPRYDPSLTLAQRLEASTDLPLAPFPNFERKKENEYVYLTAWQPADRRGRKVRLGE